MSELPLCSSSFVPSSSSTHFDTSYLGSLDLVSLDNNSVVQQLVLHLRPEGSDRTMTNNPMFFERLNGVIRFYFALEDDRTTIYSFHGRYSAGFGDTARALLIQRRLSLRPLTGRR